MDRHREACDEIDFFHHTSTPPPNEKNDRKKELAVNAIDRPNTIWISRRKPPEVSPKASVRPVVTMMITAMILETGPSIDCRIWLSGCSHGMLEPAACAGIVVATDKTITEESVRQRGDLMGMGIMFGHLRKRFRDWWTSGHSRRLVRDRGPRRVRRRGAGSRGRPARR